MTKGFPYEKSENTALWSVVNHAIEDLVKNTDIIETTNRRYIVGYLCKALCEAEIANFDTGKR
jgi:hypothetical protein